MAYDRHDTRNAPRDERSRWRDERDSESGGRGFFERAGDEIASWFGDDEAERRRHQDAPADGPDRDRDWNRERGHDRDRGRDRDRHESGMFGRGQSDDRDHRSSHGREQPSGGSRDRDFGRPGGGYRPMTGDYGRATDHESDHFFAASGYGRGERGERDRSQSEWSRDQYRSTSRAGTSDHSDRSRHEDPHYHSWRQRQINELDRDYDDYRREHQSKFENDFSSWRERRQQKRGMLGQIREHMEVVGNDEQHVGTVDKVAGDRLILTKSDPDSGGAHHSLSCSDVDRIEGDRVILDCSADQARNRWRDESRSRALFERDDQGEMGPGVLDRSFSGTYR